LEREWGGPILLHLGQYRNDTFGPYLDYGVYTQVDFVLDQKFSGGHQIGLIGDIDLHFVFQMKNLSGGPVGYPPKNCIRGQQMGQQKFTNPIKRKLNRVFLIMISYRYIQNFVTSLLVSFSKLMFTLLWKNNDTKETRV
jgi:hypothetical protein